MLLGNKKWKPGNQWRVPKNPNAPPWETVVFFDGFENLGSPRTVGIGPQNFFRKQTPPQKLFHLNPSGAPKPGFLKVDKDQRDVW